jgi:hypothetical protein
MRKITVFAPLLLLAAVLLPTSAAFAGNDKAVKAGKVTFTNPFGSNSCTATFVRAASGIINESGLACSPGPQNIWARANVYLQYRLLSGTPNPNCDSDGLVFNLAGWSTTDSALTKDYFVAGAPYNVCVYLVNPVIATGNLDVDTIDGTTTSVIPLSGKYSVCITGVYDTHLLYADAKYVSWDQFQTAGTDAVSGGGWDFLGAQYGEVQVNGEFVDWGPYNTSHTYCHVIASTGNSFNLRVFDATEGTPPEQFQAWWWEDNTNINMRYMITYFGQ